MPADQKARAKRGGANKGRGWEKEATAILASMGCQVVPHAVPRGETGRFDRGAAPPDASLFLGEYGAVVDFKEVHGDTFTIAGVRESQRKWFDKVYNSAVVVRFVMEAGTYRCFIPWTDLKALKLVQAAQASPLNFSELLEWMRR